MVGGWGGGYLSSTETWSPGDSSWTTVSLSPLPRYVYGAGSVSLNNRIYLFGDYFNNGGDCSLLFVLAGNGNSGVGGPTSDADNVYEWNGDEEHWTVHGTILERKDNVGVSLVPLSSGVLDHCTK